MTSNAQEPGGGNLIGQTAGKLKGSGFDYRIIFDITVNGMAFTEFDSGKVIDVNAAWIRSTGIDREKAVGRTALELGIWSNPTDRETCLAELEKKGRVVDFEAKLIMKSAESFHLVSAEVVESDGERYTLWEFRDITEQKRIHDELIKSEEKIKSLLAVSEQSRRALLGILEDEKLAKEDLRRSEEKFRKIFEDHAAVKLLIDPESGDIVDANESAAVYYGWNREELKRMKIEQINILTPEEINKEMQNALSHNRTQFEFRHRRKDGSLRDVEVFSSKIKIGNKDLLHSIVHDITERKRTAESLAEERRLLNGLIENIPDNIYFKDREGRFTRVNRSFAKWVELDDPQLAVGKTDFDFFAKSHARLARKDEQQILSGNESVISKEEKEIWPDGRVTWVSTNKVPIKDEHGAVIGVMGISRDITENKKAEEALANSEAKFKSIYEGSTDAIILLDQNGFLDCNPGALEMFGFKTKSEFVGLLPADVSPPNQPDGKKSLRSAKEQMRTAYEAGHVRFEWMHRRANGEDFPSEVLLSAFELNGKKVLQATVRDITERKKAEEAIRQSEEKFRTLFMSMSEGFYISETIHDDDGNPCDYRYLDVNPKFEQILGLSRDQIIGKRYKELVPVDTTQWLDTYFQVARTGVPLNYDFYSPEHNTYFETLSYRTNKDQVTVFVVDITERKRAEQLLRESEFTARTLINSTTDIAILIDAKDGKIIDINEIGASNIGKKVPDLIGKPALETIPDDSEKNRLRRILNSMEKGTPDRFEDERNGRFYDNRIHPIWGDDGNVIRVAVYATDITERKKSEEALRKSEEKFSKAFRSSPGIVGISTMADGKYIDINGNFTNFLEWDRGEVIGHTSRELGIFAEFSRREELATILRETGSLNNFEVPLKTKSGKNRTGLFSAEQIDVEGQPCVLAQIQDITERKLAEKALKESEEKFAKVFHAAPVLISITDLKSGVYIDVNDEALRISGYTRKEVLGRTAAELGWIASEDRDRMLKELQDHGRIAGLEMTFRTKSGNRLQGYVNGEKIIIGEGWPCLLTVTLDITDRKKAEETLLASEERFRRIFQHSASGMVLVAPSFRFIQVNDSFCKMMGYTEPELLEKTFQEVTLPEDRPIGGELVGKVLSGEMESFHFEKRYLRKDGTVVWGLVSSTLIRDSQNKPLHFVTQVQNITERKQAEEALTASEIRYRRLFEAAKDGILILDAVTGTVVDVNPFLIEMLGFSREQFMEKKIWELGFFKDIISNQDNFAELQRQGYIRYEDLPLETADGRRIDIEFISNVYEVNHDKVIQCNIRNITDRKRTEAELANTKAMLEAAFEQTPIPMVLVNMPDGVLRITNSASLDYLGLMDEPSPVGRSLADFKPSYLDYDAAGNLTQVSEAPLASAMRGQRTINQERRIVTKDGTNKWALVSANPIYNARGEIIAAYLIFPDITERKRTEEALRESEERFRKLFTTSPDALILFDPSSSDVIWKIVDCNEVACSMNGYTRKELIGSSVDILNAEVLSPEEHHTHVGRVRNKEYYQFETLHRHKDGHIFPIEVSTAIITLEGRELVLGLDRDITDRKQAEEAVQALSSRNEVILSAIPDIIMEVNNDKVYTWANHAGFEFFGEDVLGHEAAFYFEGEQDTYDVVKPLFNGHQDVTYVESWQRKINGEKRLLAWSCRMLKDAEGKVIGALSSAHDITERKRAEEALHESEEKYREMVEQINDVIYTTDAVGKFTYISPTVEILGGYKPREMIGHSMGEFLDPQFIQKNKEQFQKVISGKLEPTEYRVRIKSGEFKWVRSSSKPILKGNRLIGLRGVLTDITERKRAEEEVKHTNEMFALFMRHSPIYTFIKEVTPQQSLVLQASDNYSDMIGVSGREMIGKTMRDLFPPEFADKMTADDWAVVTKGEVLKLDEELNGRSYNTIKFPIVQGNKTLLAGYTIDITDRKQAEEALKKSELQYRLLAENMSDVVFQSDFDARMEYVSPSVRDLFGYTHQEYLEMPLEKKFTPESYANLMKNRKHGSNMLELQMLRKNGDPIWVESKTSPYHDEEGRLKGIIGVIRDISERREAERRGIRHLHEQETIARVSSALVGMETSEAIHGFIGPIIQKESGADYIVIGEFDRRTENVHVRYASGLKGFASKWIHLTGKSIKTLSIPIRRIEPEFLKLLMTRTLNFVPDAIRTFFGDVAPKGLISKIDKTFKIDSTHMMGFVWGEGLYGGVILGCVKGNSVRNTQFVETLINEAAIVIQRRQAEEARRESEERFRSMILTANEGVWILDKTLSTVMVNQKMAEMLDYTIDEMLGMNPIDFMPRDDNRTYQSQIRERKKGRPGQYEQVFLRKDGGLIWLLISASSVLDDKGRFVGSFGMLTDITDRKRAEQERERLIKELRGKNEELEAFTYTVSHDLKSPLVTVKGFVGMLQKDIASGNPDAVGTSIHFINDAVTKMESLLRDLLDMSRVGRMVQPYQNIPFGRLARQSAQLLAGMIRERGVKLIVTRDRTSLHGDPVRMSQLMMNLLSNAVKFMGDQPDPVIEAGIRYESEGPVFYVKDNGIGINPKFHEKIFGLFDKLDPSTDGTGVGLAIVKRIIQIHNGRIWIESEGEGRGSTVCFTLPKG